MLQKIAFATLMLGAASVALADTTVLDKREANQEQRIEQGVKSGELTKAEAHRLERSENRLEKNESKAKADGVVTARERAKLQHEADHNSARIHRQKHDRQDRN